MKRLAVVITLLALLPMPILAQSDLDAELRNRLYQLDSPRLYISVDKPLYRPGETIWFRAFELSLETMMATYDHMVTVKLIDPRGATALEKNLWSSNGLATNDLELPSDMVGGEYTIRAVSDRGYATERPIIVSTYEAPRIKKKLEFVRKAYGPGDTVTATVELERATGEALAETMFTALVVLDEAELVRQTFTTDAKGESLVKFALPAMIAKGDGLLTVLVDDGGVTESIQRRIPITMDRIDLAIFPEGGDLVEGLDNRVYFQAKSLIGKPIDIEASVVDEAGSVVSTVTTYHNGMGRFDLKPQQGHSYQLVVAKPSTVKQSIALPQAIPRGCTLRSKDDYNSEREPLVVVACTESTNVVVAAVLREQLLFSTSAVGDAEGISLELPIGSVQGAVRVTVFDAALNPLAERLIWRGLQAGLKVEVIPDKASYSPRDLVTLTIAIKDSLGNPVQGNFTVSVVDDTILSYADDKNANILAGILLQPEMPGQYIEEPNFYFSDDPKAPQAMDLLLGTLGWRHFEWQWVRR